MPNAKARKRKSVTLSQVRVLVTRLRHGSVYHDEREQERVSPRNRHVSIEQFMSNMGRNSGPSEVARKKRERRLGWLAEHTQTEICRCERCSAYTPDYQKTVVAQDNPQPGTARQMKTLCGRCVGVNTHTCAHCSTAFAEDLRLSVTRDGELYCNHCLTGHTQCPRCNYYCRPTQFTAPDVRPDEERICFICHDDELRNRREEERRRREREERGPILNYSTRAPEALTHPWLQLPGERTDRNGNLEAQRATARYPVTIPYTGRPDEFRFRQAGENPAQYYNRIAAVWNQGVPSRTQYGLTDTILNAVFRERDAFLRNQQSRETSRYNLSVQPTMWLGFELEARCKGNVGQGTASTAITDAFAGRGICKSDSSIGGPGFEMVSLPGTLAYHQTQWTGDARQSGLPDWLRVVQKYMKAWEQPTCGMHVHVSRRALTALQIARANRFITSPGNRRVVEKIAGRSNERYALLRPKGLKDSLNGFGVRSLLSEYVRPVDMPSIRAAKSGTGAMRGERGEGLNLTNPDTVEVRLFQANCATVGFLKNIEFCHALFTWAAEASNLHLTSDAFMAWMDRNRGVYPNFTLWAVREGMLTKRHNEAEEAVLCA